MNNTTLDEIRKALKEAHEHGLDADPMPWPGNANLQYWVGDQYDGIGAFVKYEDAYLAANAPTWLRSLLEERDHHIDVFKRIHADITEFSRLVGVDPGETSLAEKGVAFNLVIQQLREELELKESEYQATLDKANKASQLARQYQQELAAKDKVLKYADNEIESAFNLLREDSFENAEDAGEKMGMVHRTIRSTLEQYARSAIVPNE